MINNIINIIKRIYETDYTFCQASLIALTLGALVAITFHFLDQGDKKKHGEY